MLGLLLVLDMNRKNVKKLVKFYFALHSSIFWKVTEFGWRDQILSPKLPAELGLLNANGIKN